MLIYLHAFTILCSILLEFFLSIDGATFVAVNAAPKTRFGGRPIRIMWRANGGIEKTKKALWLHDISWHCQNWPWLNWRSWLNHHFHLISTWFPLTSMKPSDWPLQARRRTCSLSIWRHDTIRHGGHDGHGHGMPRSALKAESRSCRAQAFRNAQFEPLPEPSRKERCCHVLKHVTCLNMSYLVSQSAEETCFSSLWKSPPYKMIQNVHKIQLIQQSLLRTDYCALSLSSIALSSRFSGHHY